MTSVMNSFSLAEMKCPFSFPLTIAEAQPHISMSNSEMSKLQQMRPPFPARIYQGLCVGPNQGLISLLPIMIWY